MDIVRNLFSSKLIRIFQDDLNRALKDLLIKENIIENIDDYKIEFPKLGSSDLIKIEYEIKEE